MAVDLCDVCRMGQVFKVVAEIKFCRACLYKTEELFRSGQLQRFISNRKAGKKDGRDQTVQRPMP